MHPRSDFEQSYARSSHQENLSLLLTSDLYHLLSKRYGHVEKKALAFTWACECLANYLIGLHFHIFTDQKLQVPLFSTKCLEEMSSRVERFHLRMHFHYSISHVPGKELVIADVLSQFPAEHSTEANDVLYQGGNSHIKVVMQSLPATEQRIDEIRKCQEQNETCQLTFTYCHTFWPDKQTIPSSSKASYALSLELFVENGLLMWRNQMMIPPALWKYIHHGFTPVTRE